MGLGSRLHLPFLGSAIVFIIIIIYIYSLITCLLVNSFLIAVSPLQSVKEKDDVEKIWRPAIFCQATNSSVP